MHFLLGFLLGYYTRNKPLLAATLLGFALVCFIVLPAIALSGLALSVRRERLSRPPQTRVPQLVGLDYKTAETTLHNSKLNIRVLAHRYDPPAEPGKVLFQTPQAGESVDCGTVVGIVISKEDRDNKKAPSLSRAVRLYMLQAVILPCNRSNCDIPVNTSEIVHVSVRKVFFPCPPLPAENCSW